MKTDRELVLDTFGERNTVSKLDKAGMTASTICAIHCAIMPVAIGVLPIIGLGFVADGWFEWMMVGTAALVGGVSMKRGQVRHRRHTAWCFFVPGLVAVLLGLSLLEETPGLFPWKAIVMAIGGFTIATAHFINSKLCKTCVKCEDDHGLLR